MSFITYTPEQMNEIQDFINQHFGEGDYVAHELESEYVHTDVNISRDELGMEYVTFGMGALSMNAPIEPFERIELIMSASEDVALTSKESTKILEELVALSKYPFRNGTWFGAGHTVAVSDGFKDLFGYEYVLFAPTEYEVELDDIGTVRFLRIVPIYHDEREWMIENDSLQYLEKLYDEYGDEIFLVDRQREHFIPMDEDDILCRHLGIDKVTLESLREYLRECEKIGEEMSYEKIGAWIEQNRNKERQK